MVTLPKLSIGKGPAREVLETLANAPKKDRDNVLETARLALNLSADETDLFNKVISKVN